MIRARLTGGDVGVLASCLARLLPHLETEHVALTGGVAIGLHVPGRRRARPKDLDFVARRMDAVSPSVTRDFLVAHFHVPGPAVPKAIVQLVDPSTRLRIDVFPDLTGALAHARWRTVETTRLQVLEPEALLAHKLRLLAGPVDEKHWLDAVALAARLGEEPPARPARFVPDAYRQDLDGRCARCERSRDPRYPLAPRRVIFGLLGYV